MHMAGKNNFIKDLDDIYTETHAKNPILKDNQKFCLHVPVETEIYGNKNRNFIIRKKKQLSRFAYIKNGCRVYFSDADILTMLLEIEDKNTMDRLLQALIKAYYEEQKEQYYIRIGQSQYMLFALDKVGDKQVLTNKQDVDITFDELYVLINLILSKDRMSNEIWQHTHGKDYYMHTISKYITLLKYYYYGDKKAGKYLQQMGYDTGKSIYQNYDTTAKRDEKRWYFMSRKAFESSGVL